MTEKGLRRIRADICFDYELSEYERMKIISYCNKEIQNHPFND